MHKTVCFLICLLAFAAASRAQTINTVAGGGLPNNIPATSDGVGWPWGMAVDSPGNFYFSSYTLSSVFKVNPSGMNTVVAGTDSLGYNGDGIAATSAMLYGPTGVAVDPVGNIYR